MENSILDFHFVFWTSPLRERVFFEGDPGKTCRNYPNTEFVSYSECDDKYVGKRIDEIALVSNWLQFGCSTTWTRAADLTSKLVIPSEVFFFFKLDVQTWRGWHLSIIEFLTGTQMSGFKLVKKYERWNSKRSACPSYQLHIWFLQL